MDFYFLPVMNPDGYDYTFTDDAVASAAVDAIYTYSGTRYKQQQYCLESDLCVYGNSIDYFKGLTTIKYCYLVQLPDLGNYGYLLPPTEIIPVGEESLRGLIALIDAILKE
ncbi:hypothetical protein Avbf_04978 [Armadillidium vulgare]|nr:hypothetical protein Avbf_04978 [Armadillidium vulgare]